jgi:mono/diheme cytochrome c family protein
MDSGPPVDASDSGDAGPSVTGMKIVSQYDAGLRAAPGDALPLLVVFTLSDGTTRNLPAGVSLSWTAPGTIAAQDPTNPNPTPEVPEAGAQPTAFYVSNNYRPDHPGVLFVTDPGTVADASVPVAVTVGDAGSVSAVVDILPAPVGDATRGQTLFQTVLKCANCHGQTAAGSPPIDGGDGALEYGYGGDIYPYPAPGLNDEPGNLASDPAWSAGLLGMAAQADMDNMGVALRAPMPTFMGKLNAAGQTLGAQDFADIYAFLKTQTQ